METTDVEAGITFEEILIQTIESIRRTEGTDGLLLDTLVRHIATLSPEEDAVDSALKELVGLANSRGEED